MKKLIIFLVLVALTAVLDATFALSLPIQCYVVLCFFLGASVLEMRSPAEKEQQAGKKEQHALRMSA